MDHTETPAPRALVILAAGAEEMEVTIVVDVLRRAGLDVVLAGLSGQETVRCSRGLLLAPDVALRSVDPGSGFDVIVLPGGAEGAERLAESSEVGELLRDQIRSGRLVGAICAAPLALAAHGVGAGLRMTSHPSVAEAIVGHAGRYEEASVVTDGALITSRGPGTAFDFAFAIVAALCGAAAVDAVRAPMQFG